MLVMPYIPASNLFVTVGFVVAERVLYIPRYLYFVIFDQFFSRFEYLYVNKYRNVLFISEINYAFMSLNAYNKY
jgi:hypothetical protein